MDAGDGGGALSGNRKLEYISIEAKPKRQMVVIGAGTFEVGIPPAAARDLAFALMDAAENGEERG